MKHLLRLLIIFITAIGTHAYAGNIDPLLLRAQATIFPKIVLLDKELGNKMIDEKIVINIVYSATGKAGAGEMQRLIRAEYQNSLGGNTLQVDLRTFDEFDENKPATAYILMNGPAIAQKKISQHAASQRRIVFCYDYKDMNNNALISLLMKEKTYIYLNKKNMTQYNVNFMPLFYKIIRVIE